MSFEGFEPDRTLSGDGLEQGDHSLDQGGEVGLYRFHLALAGKIEELADQLGHAVHLIDDDARLVVHLLGGDRSRDELFGARVDDVERRAQFVCESRCESPDGSEAVGVPQLRQGLCLGVGLGTLALLQVAKAVAHAVHLLRDDGDLVVSAGRDPVREIALSDSARLDHER